MRCRQYTSNLQMGVPRFGLWSFGREAPNISSVPKVRQLFLQWFLPVPLRRKKGKPVLGTVVIEEKCWSFSSSCESRRIERSCDCSTWRASPDRRFKRTLQNAAERVAFPDMRDFWRKKTPPRQRERYKVYPRRKQIRNRSHPSQKHFSSSSSYIIWTMGSI